MINTKELKEYIESNPSLVTRRESTNYPGLFVIKYTRRVFYDALWNDVLEECRGLVVDKDWNVVIRPFKKIYNHTERGVTMKPYDKVIMVEKVNGFMGALTFVNGQPVISTTGSLDSPFVEMAKEMLMPFLPTWPTIENVTYLFEIVHKDDPHIIKEDVGVYLIGIRHIKTGYMFSEEGLDNVAMSIELRRPKWVETEFWDAEQRAKLTKLEGYVVRSLEEDLTLKIKSPYYLTLKAAARKKDIMMLNKAFVDEEFYALIDNIKENEEMFNALDEQERLEYMKEFLSGSN